MKKSTFLFLMLFMHQQIVGLCQTNVGGTLTQNTVWNLAGSPYTLTSTVGVLPGITLTIQPGVQVIGDFDIVIRGGILLMSGAEGQRIKVQGSRILFKSSDLSKSSIAYVDFDQAGVQLGDENEFNQDNVKNSNTLLAKNATLSNNSFCRTKGYQTTAKLRFELSAINNSIIIGYYPRSEPIELDAVNINNTTITSDSYNFGIKVTNSIVNNTSFLMGCCDANFDIFDSEINNSSFREGSGQPVNGLIRLDKVNFTETYFSLPSAKFLMTNCTAKISSSIPVFMYMGNGEIKNSSIEGSSSTTLFKVSGMSGYNVGSNVVFQNMNFNIFGTAIEIFDFNQLTVSQNNFLSASNYNLKNNSSKDIIAIGNYWGTNNEQTIKDKIYDIYDNINSGLVNYGEFLQSKVPNALPIITWANPADIEYGTTLGIAQLNATSSVDGSFLYAPASGTKLNVGNNQRLSVAFTPTDAVNYTSVTKKVIINVDKGTPLIVWPNPSDIVYGTLLGTTQLNATSTVEGTFSYTPAIGTKLNVGGNQSLSVLFTPTDLANYKSSTRQVSINVIKAPQTITFTALTSKTFGDAPFILSGTSSSGLALTYTSSNTSVATVSGNTVTIVGAGTANITAKQAGNSNYNPAVDVTQSLIVNKASQTITFTSLANKTFGDAPFTLSGTSSSGLAVTYTSSNTSVATVASGTITIVGVGTITIVAKQTGNDNYNPAIDVTQSLTVFTPPPTIISFSPLIGDVGTSVTITGTNFNATPSNNLVTFGATRAAITEASTTQLIVTVPSGATYAPVAVLNLATGLLAYSASKFTPTFSPHKESIASTDFNPKIDYTTGLNPYSVAIGDLDGDGMADLAVANYSSNTVSVFRNTTSGGALSYASKIDFAAGNLPYSVAIGDLNGDGKPDLAIVNGDGPASAVSILTNTGSAGTISFASKVSFNTGLSSVAVAIGDLDGDGRADLAVANNNSTTVSVLRNISSGSTISFASKLDYTVGLGPFSVAIADLNGDTKPDLAVANSGSNTVSIMRNTGSIGAINFAAKVDANTGLIPYSVAIGDLDKDGKPDLAVASYNSSAISVFRNTGNSTTISFGTKIDFPSSNYPNFITMNDLNGDGKIDLVATNFSSNNVSVLRNTSNIDNLSFSAKLDIATGTNPYAVAIGDLDGDGKPELAVANSNANSISIIRNNIKVDQTITFNTLPVKTYGNSPFTLAATTSSNLPITYSSSDLTVATISGSIVTVLKAGSTTITAKQAGNNNYNPAADVAQSLTVSKAPQTITFAALSSKTFGDAPFTLAGTSSSGLSVTYASNNTAVATVSGNTVTIVGAGAATITAKQAGNNNYNAAVDVAQSLTVNKASQTITFAALSSKTFGDAPFTLSATSSSGLAPTYTSSNTAVATVSGNTVTIVGAGIASITARQAGNSNYNAGETSRQLTVNKSLQTITFTALANKTFSDAPFTLSGTSSVGLPLTYSSSNTGVATVSGNTVTIVGAGIATITAMQVGNTNYNPAETSRQLTVSKANQTIAFSPLANKIFGDAPFVLQGNSSSGLPLTYSSSNPSVAIVSGNSAIIVGVGITTITASQLGDGNYNVASSLDQSFTVNKADQSITFVVLSDKSLSDGSLTLSATASSSLPVSFTSNSDKISIANSTVTFLKAGRVSITASQVGNENHNAASSVTQSFCIKPAKPTVTISNLNTPTPLLTSNASSGNQWYADGTVIAGATSATFSATKSGSYKVQVTVDDCTGEFSEEQPLVITGIEPIDFPVDLYPNPVGDALTIYFGDLAGKKQVTIFALTGESLVANNTESSSIAIDVSDLSAGMYLAKVIAGGAVQTKKFKKQ
jgi:hypothetical protein